jgi:hypothetical protein
MKLIERLKAPTPKFFRVLRNVGLSLAAAGAALLAAPVTLPVAIITVAGYLTVAGGVITAVSQSAVDGETDCETNNDDTLQSWRYRSRNGRRYPPHHLREYSFRRYCKDRGVGLYWCSSKFYNLHCDEMGFAEMASKIIWLKIEGFSKGKPFFTLYNLL